METIFWIYLVPNIRCTKAIYFIVLKSAPFNFFLGIFSVWATFYFVSVYNLVEANKLFCYFKFRAPSLPNWIELYQAWPWIRYFIYCAFYLLSFKNPVHWYLWLIRALGFISWLKHSTKGWKCFKISFRIIIWIE